MRDPIRDTSVEEHPCYFASPAARKKYVNPMKLMDDRYLSLYHYKDVDALRRTRCPSPRRADRLGRPIIKGTPFFKCRAPLRKPKGSQDRSWKLSMPSKPTPLQLIASKEANWSSLKRNVRTFRPMP